jgi:uncharacterized protein
MKEQGEAISDSGSGIVVRVRVAPRSSRRGCAGLQGTQVKFNLHAAPVEDAANRELVEILAGGLRVPRSAVRIVKGGKGRDKVVSIEDVDKARFEAAFLR